MVNLREIGTGTLPVSGPGTQSTVTISSVDIQAADVIILTETKRVKDGEGYFAPYVSSVAAGSFVAAGDKNQLPETLTFNYVAFSSS